MLQPRPPSDAGVEGWRGGGAAPGNGALANSELRPARRAATARQTQPAHQADPGGHPNKHSLGPNLRRIFSDGADRSGDIERGSRDHGDPGWASSGGQEGVPSLRRGLGELLGHDFSVEAPATGGQAGRQVPVCGVLP